MGQIGAFPWVASKCSAAGHSVSGSECGTSRGRVVICIRGHRGDDIVSIPKKGDEHARPTVSMVCLQ